MSKRRDRQQVNSAERQAAFGKAFLEFNSNLYGWLVKNDWDMRYLRFKWREDETVLAIIGIYDEMGAEMVAFGSGGSFIEACDGLGRTLAKGGFKEEKPYQPKDE